MRKGHQTNLQGDWPKSNRKQSQREGQAMSDQSKEINDVAPTSLNHITGQQGVVEQVRVAIEAAFADGKKFDHSLLAGPPGIGKTQMASVIAQEMASEFHEILGQSIKNAGDLNAVLLAAQDRDLIHIDEAHELKKEFQTALYRAIEGRKLFIQGKSNKVQNIPLADFTLLLSTTDEYCLLQPLRDRCRLILRFQFYEPDELTTILQQRSRALGWVVDDEVLAPIAQRSRGTPRLALRLLQSARRVCRSEGENGITIAHLDRACYLEGIDTLGLGPTEQHYLRILKEGDSRLNVIASRIGLPTRTVSQVTEPFLIRVGLVTKDDQGRRQLTQEGREQLSKSRPNSV
jgi:Holliday junction DNA helicase RuvB